MAPKNRSKRKPQRQGLSDALDKQDAEELPDPADTTPFRHQE